MTYPRSLAVTWNTTVDRLPPPARTLLERLAWLAPDPIPRDRVTGEASAAPLAEAGIAEPEEALAELADVSMLQLDGEFAEVHRLVQEITRRKVPEAEREKRLGCLLAVVNQYPFGAGP